MRLVLAVIALVGCGDNLADEPVEGPRSGTRLKLEWHLYEDATRQLAVDAFYDARLHGRCRPEPWLEPGGGGVTTTRCVPEGGSTRYTDDACTVELGRVVGREPQYFVGRDVVAGAAIAARVYRAGAMAEPPATRYERRDGACEVAAPDPAGTRYYALGAPIDGLVELATALTPADGVDLDEAPLGLQLVITADGLRAPSGFVDRARGVACRPEARPDGAACVPVGAAAATAFADAACEEPAVVAPIPPAIAFTGLPGCATYHAVGGELASAPYQRLGEACVPMASAVRAFAVGAPLAFPPIERSVEDAPGRLRAIVVTAGPLRAHDPQLFDTATRAECARHPFEVGSRCLPADAPPAWPRFTNDRCGHPITIAELPRVPCAPASFALGEIDGARTVHAIGAPYAGPLYALDAAGSCVGHVTPADRVAHVVGAALPLDVFVGALPYTER